MDKAEYINQTMASYAETALWASLDDLGDPLDDSFSPDQIDLESYASMLEDVQDFVNAQWHLIRDLNPVQVGHDFWLTRNRHGAGFWDGDYPEDLGTKLTEASHVYGCSDLWASDSGWVFVS